METQTVLDRNYCEFKDEWVDVAGPWVLTKHARERLCVRYRLNSTQIHDMLENLDRGNVVRVPSYNEQANAYTVQTVVEGKGLFLIVERASKKIITAMTPYFQFQNELTSERFEVAQLDTTWADCGNGFECVETIVHENVRDNLDQGEEEPEDDVELLKKALVIANNRIKELERNLAAIKQLVIIGLEGGK